MAGRVVALVDMDCFYVQVEERERPHLRGKPAAVVQYNSWRGGGIIAVNYEARDFGVKRGMRGDQAREKCPDIQLVQVPVSRGKADLTKYRDAGKEVITVLAEFSDCIERASIDEAYLDLTGVVERRLADSADSVITADALTSTWVVGQRGDPSEDGKDERETGLNKWLSTLYKQRRKEREGEPAEEEEEDAGMGHLSTHDDLRLAVAAVQCEEMRRAVLERTGFKCSAGIAHNKMLAKLSCGLHKPNQQTVLPQEEVAGLWDQMPVGKVRNLGGKLGDSLTERLGCVTMGDLARVSQGRLAALYDPKTAHWLHSLGRGIDSEPVTARQLPKSIGCGKNFQGREALDTPEKVRRWTHSLAEELAERLEADKAANKRHANTLTVGVRLDGDERWSSLTRSCPLPSYAADRIARVSLALFQHTNTAPAATAETVWSPAIKHISLSASKFVDTGGQGSANIQEMFKNAQAKRRTDAASPKMTYASQPTSAASISSFFHSPSSSSSLRSSSPSFKSPNSIPSSVSFPSVSCVSSLPSSSSSATSKTFPSTPFLSPKTPSIRSMFTKTTVRPSSSTTTTTTSSASKRAPTKEEEVDVSLFDASDITADQSEAQEIGDDQSEMQKETGNQLELREERENQSEPEGVRNSQSQLQKERIEQPGSQCERENQLEPQEVRISQSQLQKERTKPSGSQRERKNQLERMKLPESQWKGDNQLESKEETAMQEQRASQPGSPEDENSQSGSQDSQPESQEERTSQPESPEDANNQPGSQDSQPESQEEQTSQSELQDGNDDQSGTSDSEPTNGNTGEVSAGTGQSTSTLRVNPGRVSFPSQGSGGGQREESGQGRATNSFFRNFLLKKLGPVKGDGGAGGSDNGDTNKVSGGGGDEDTVSGSGTSVKKDNSSGDVNVVMGNDDVDKARSDEDGGDDTGDEGSDDTTDLDILVSLVDAYDDGNEQMLRDMMKDAGDGDDGVGNGPVTMQTSDNDDDGDGAGKRRLNVGQNDDGDDSGDGRRKRRLVIRQNDGDDRTGRWERRHEDKMEEKEKTGGEDRRHTNKEEMEENEEEEEKEEKARGEDRRDMNMGKLEDTEDKEKEETIRNKGRKNMNNHGETKDKETERKIDENDDNTQDGMEEEKKRRIEEKESDAEDVIEGSHSPELFSSWEVEKQVERIKERSTRRRKRLKPALEGGRERSRSRECSREAAVRGGDNSKSREKGRGNRAAELQRDRASGETTEQGDSRGGPRGSFISRERPKKTRESFRIEGESSSTRERDSARTSKAEQESRGGPGGNGISREKENTRESLGEEGDSSNTRERASARTSRTEQGESIGGQGENGITRESLGVQGEGSRVLARELFPDLDNIDTSLLPLLPRELREEVEQQLARHSLRAGRDERGEEVQQQATVEREERRDGMEGERQTRIEMDVGRGGRREGREGRPEDVTGGVRSARDPGQPVKGPATTTADTSHKNGIMRYIQRSPRKPTAPLPQGAGAGDMVSCEECHEWVSAFELPEHLDYHVALRLQSELRRTGGGGEGLSRPSPPPSHARRGGKKRGRPPRTSPPSASGKKTQRLDSFFTR